VPQSQYSIAIMLARGDGIKQDFAKAGVLRRSYF
jgi:TPR repeat protein